MNWHIYPHPKDGWVLRKRSSGRATAVYSRRREAITEAKHQAAKTKGVVFVHNSAGEVVIRIPDLPVPEKVAASVFIYDASAMTRKGRKEIAGWLRAHAAWLLKEGDNYAKRFRGRYFYPA